jgi:glycosyltransferase involved in cell wall biosynthesis
LALVTRCYPPSIGGAEKVLSYLAKALAVEGADVTVLTSRIPGLGLPAREDVSVHGAHGVACEGDKGPGRLTVVWLETSRLRFWGTWCYMWNLRQWFRAYPVDLAYVSMLKHDAYVAIGAGERLGFPVVLRPEGAGKTGDVAWQSWGRFGRMIGLQCRRADAFVAISGSIKHEIQVALDSGSMRPARFQSRFRHSRRPRLVELPNGVPLPQSPWQRRLDWQAAPVAMFVGRLAPEKGLGTLLSCWPLVQARYPKARLVLVGEGSERTALEAQARALGLTLGPGHSVEFSGFSGAVTEALRTADLFVLPSREEGMSIALLEAMALGMPLVASSIPGNCRLVVDYEQGRLAPPDEPTALAQVIIWQWSNFDRATDMGRAARDRVEREFSIQSVARRHLALFEEILLARNENGSKAGNPMRQ